MQRLERYLSEMGLYSRKEWKQILKSGRVQLNGAPIYDGSLHIDAKTDEVCLDGQRLFAKKTVVLMMNKPAGYVTATKDAVEKTVMELLPPQYQKLGLLPVGRLDKETEGLLLFTNDGELLHRLISPRSGIQKTYYAEHEGTASEADVQAFAQGVILRDGTHCLPACLRPLGPGKSEITVREGKYHQVRRMMASRGLPVVYLRRTAEANLELGDLPLGKVREMFGNQIVTN